jgi:hypothetical protein
MALAIVAATSCEVSDPLNLSGATRIRIFVLG